MTVPQGYARTPVPFTDVSIADAFWRPRLDTNRQVTLPYCFRKCEETGRIANFDRAAGRLPGPHEGIYYNDSDVFKVMEGAAYALALDPDPQLDAYMDDLIERVGAAQEEDGYLYTARTIDPEAVTAEAEGPARWSNLPVNHELYNAGHMYEAAAAHFRATGKRTFLDIALRNAELVARVFGPDSLHDVPGHQEIELGLVKLFQVTGEERWLDLAHFFLDQRGRHECRPAAVRFANPDYMQDHLPLAAQTSAVGHAVRAGYMYAAIADMMALRPEPAWQAALDALWEDVVQRKLYLHGGIGARHQGEAFGAPYELPNATAYAETCAAIALVFWSHRMFLARGHSTPMDVLELALYNGVLSGLGLNGQEFFYPNPLASDGRWAFNRGHTGRQPWFDCSCCPTNLVRFLPALPGWIYAVHRHRLHVNLYIGSQATISLPDAETTVRIRQTTDYPWHGHVRLAVHPETPVAFQLALRVPGWLQAPAPGGLYAYADEADVTCAIRVNGESVPTPEQDGYRLLERTWQDGDVVEITWPMPIRTVQCHEAVRDNRNRVALMRGPLVYCVEEADNSVPLPAICAGAGTTWQAAEVADLPAGSMAIQGQTGDIGFTAIPYHLWAHRGSGAMAVWLERT